VSNSSTAEIRARMGRESPREYARALGQARRLRASGIFARAARPTDERRRSSKKQKFSSGSDTTHSRMKTWRGVVRGRTPKARQCEAKNLHHHYYLI